ncbi:MAG: DegV family EDD domain-containing protein [Ruminococcaceae bacterium]|nr:DegV family EDD domain-containing protein [Oscillospiraceae bacterium]
MKFKLITDSSANLREIHEDVDFASVPLTIRVEDREFVDDETLDLEDMLHTLATTKSKSSSSCPNVEDYLTAFGDADRIFCITITSNLSGSYNAARLAKEEYEAAHPDRKVYVIDSLSAGPELKLLAHRIIELIKNSELYENICTKIAEYQTHTRLMFCLESMKNLANNGRVSPIVAKIAGVLGIRAVGKASDVGTLEMLDKVRGEKGAVAKIFERMQEMGYRGGKVRIDNCCNLPAAKQLQALIVAKFPKAQVIHDTCKGLCSFYAEKGGLMVGFECN